MNIRERAEAMIALLDQERDAIARFDLDALERLVDQKAECAQELAQALKKQVKSAEDKPLLAKLSARAEANRALITDVTGAFEASLGIQRSSTYDMRARLRGSMAPLAGTRA